MTKKSGIDIFYDLISQGCNDPKVYEALLPYPIEVYGGAAIKQQFPNVDVDKLDIMKLVKEEIIDRKHKVLSRQEVIDRLKNRSKQNHTVNV